MRSGSVGRRSPGGLLLVPTVAVPDDSSNKSEKVEKREAYIPAQHSPPSPQARLSRPHAHPSGPIDHQGQAPQGPHPALGLIWRIRGRRAFQNLARSGRTVRTETLWCTFLNDPAAQPLRVAFAVGRSVGTAVRRNRLRRRLRAIVASIAPDIGLRHGWLLIGAKPAADKHTFDSLRSEVAALLARIIAIAPG